VLDAEAAAAAESERIVRYEIRDSSGRLVAVHVRRDGPGGKSFTWERPDGTPGLGGLRVANLPLYGSEHLAARPHDSVVVTEGERAAQALLNVGILAVGTVTGASGTPSPEMLRPLVGRSVTLWPDNDAAGREHMERIGAILQQLGATPRWIEWPDAPPHGDAVDFLDEQGDSTALDRIIAEARLFGERRDGVVLADVQPQAVRWLWPSRIPLGKLTVLDGDPGLGKSLITLDLAARITTGRPMPDGARSDLHDPRGVVLLTAEDDLADTVRPRLDAMGADVTRILALPTVRGAEGGEAMPTIADLAAIEAAVRWVDAALVIIDPLMAYIPDRRDSHRDQDVRRAMAPLAKVAADLGVAFLVIRHLNKQGGGNPIYRGGGSIGIIGAVRSGLLVAPDPDDSEGRRRILVPTKANLSAPAPALAYTIEAVDGVVRIAWHGPTGHTAAALLAVQNGEERPAIEEAATFLRDLLSDGRKPATEIKAAARQAGIAERTLDRARLRIGATTRREGFGPGATWFWSLPPSPPPFSPRHQGVAGGKNGPVGENVAGSGFQPSPEHPLAHSRQPTSVGVYADGGSGEGGRFSPPDSPCHACGSTRCWQSVYGRLVCAVCHPPAHPALVARWVGPEPEEAAR
jgi:hypothetical protein